MGKKLVASITAMSLALAGCGEVNKHNNRTTNPEHDTKPSVALSFNDQIEDRIEHIQRHDRVSSYISKRLFKQFVLPYKNGECFSDPNSVRSENVIESDFRLSTDKFLNVKTNFAVDKDNLVITHIGTFPIQERPRTIYLKGLGDSQFKPGELSTRDYMVSIGCRFGE